MPLLRPHVQVKSASFLLSGPLTSKLQHCRRAPPTTTFRAVPPTPPFNPLSPHANAGFRGTSRQSPPSPAPSTKAANPLPHLLPPPVSTLRWDHVPHPSTPWGASHHCSCSALLLAYPPRLSYHTTHPYHTPGTGPSPLWPCCSASVHVLLPDGDISPLTEL